MRAPPLLAAGARVGLVAPSGPLRDPSDVDRAIQSVRSMSWEPVVGSHVLERHGYLAGSDADRVADLNQFAADDSVDAVWCIRGGYGAMRLLDDLDYDAWRRRPKTLIGFSDITALHAAIGLRADIITFHGPTARASLTPFSKASLHAAVAEAGGRALAAPTSETLRKGHARGTLVGGNLAVLAALAGTPYAPSLHGAILFLEDVNEAVYRIDRLLTQLRLSGALNDLAGIVFGQFTDIPPEPAAEPRTLESLLQEVADACWVPALAGVPVGHVDDQWTLPVGAMAVLNADDKTLILE